LEDLVFYFKMVEDFKCSSTSYWCACYIVCRFYFIQKGS